MDSSHCSKPRNRLHSDTYAPYQVKNYWYDNMIYQYNFFSLLDGMAKAFCIKDNNPNKYSKRIIVLWKRYQAEIVGLGLVYLLMALVLL
jgi:hypothetical protein